MVRGGQPSGSIGLGGLSVKRARGFSCLDAIIFVTVPLFILVIGIPAFYSFRTERKHNVCKKNLEFIGAALEARRADQGHYPRSLSELEEVPECPWPSAGPYFYTVGTEAPFNTEGHSDYVLLECMGRHHANYDGPDYPKWNSIDGLLPGGRL